MYVYVELKGYFEIECVNYLVMLLNLNLTTDTGIEVLHLVVSELWFNRF